MESLSRLLALFREVRSWFEDWSGVRCRDLIDVDLVDREGMQRICRQAETEDTPLPLGVCRYDREPEDRRRRLDLRIAVLTGFPDWRVRQTLVHELAHAVWFAAGRGAGDEVLMEGFAQWVRYHYDVATGKRNRARELMSDRTAYGRGLVRFFNRERVVGVQGVIRECLDDIRRAYRPRSRQKLDFE